MNKWLFYEKGNDTKAKIVLEYNIKPSEDLLKEHYVVIDSDNIKEPEQKEGKTPHLYCNPKTKELWYEYEDLPKEADTFKALQDRIEMLEKNNVKLMNLIAIK